MKTTVSFYDFREAFYRADRGEQFTTEGLITLYDFLEQWEEETGQEIELDVVALCCEFTEYKDIEEIKNDYSSIEKLEDLENNTLVIPFHNGYIIQNF